MLLMIIRKTKAQYFTLIVILLLVIASCSNIKYLKPGQQLYVGSKVKITDKNASKAEIKSLQSELGSLLRPRPNSAILGLRFKLYMYNIAGTPKKPKGLKHWLKTKVGEPPVLFSKVDLDFNSRLIENRLENRGYFLTQVTADSTEKNKKVTVEYAATTGPQYKIRNVSVIDDSSRLTKAVKGVQAETFFKAGEPYDLDKIKAERARIDTRLKEQGFYYFGPDYLIIQTDSTVGNHQVDLFTKVKNETPLKAKEIYTIDDIFIYPNFTLNKDTKKDSVSTADSVTKYNDFTIIDPEKNYKPSVFDRSMFFHKGDIYNRTDHNLSLNRLVNLGTFKFVKNQFKESDTSKNALDTYYYLTPLPKKSLRLELLGKTNSANYTGSEVNLNWSNRNAFRGAELLNISLFGGAEVQVSGLNKGYNIFRVGTEANLIWPRIISPFKFNPSGAFVPKTKLTVGAELQNRAKLYTLNTFKGSFGYLFKENVRKEHQLNITEITYVNTLNQTPEYEERAKLDANLRRITEKQLIFGPTYTFTYTNTTESAKTNTFYYKGNIDLSGNIVGLATGSKAGDSTSIFGVPFSQFVKIDNDFRHYFKLGTNSQIASRFQAGVGYAYGNSVEMPFIKQFFTGGTNSIRAFRARSIGPGAYVQPPVAADAFIPDQSGDIRLEFSTEYRAKLFSIVNGAIFADAGNIWLLNENANKPGGKFSKDFLNEVAVGAGAGLRLDLTILVLRLDLAMPLRKPFLPDGQRWVVNEINFGSSQWRRENLVLNLAIGYPF